jgi:hypothetical protein
MQIFPASILDFKPNDLLAVAECPLASEAVTATVTVKIRSVDLANFSPDFTAVDAAGQSLPSPVPKDHPILTGSLDLDFNALRLKVGDIVALDFEILESATEFRPSDKVPFTTNAASVAQIFLDSFASKSARLWVRLKSGEASYITYNLHFLTIAPEGKVIQWAFDPKVRNDG